MKSRAVAQWEGDLMSGHGTTSAASGIFRDAGLTWKARTEGESVNPFMANFTYFRIALTTRFCPRDRLLVPGQSCFQA